MKVLHVSLKDSFVLKRDFEREGFEMVKAKVTSSALKLQKLLYPLNLFWGGKICMLFEKVSS